MSTNRGCRWAASTPQAWLILSTTSGTGIGTVPVQVRASSSTSSRTGIVYIGGPTLTVWQVTMPSSVMLGLKAVPDAGYAFAGWTGACTGASPSVLLALNGVKTCGATFTPAGGTPW